MINTNDMQNRYGQLPKVLGQHIVDCKEFLFYQYLPIKLRGSNYIEYERRLWYFDDVIDKALEDFKNTFGLERYEDSFVYLSAKCLYQGKGCSYNRPGWHCDGFLTDDINYIWSDQFPTVFNTSEFTLTKDDAVSMIQMKEQALPCNDVVFPNGSLIRLDQYNVHKVGNVYSEGLRTFLKVSISKDKYDLNLNSHNYMLSYNWEMKARKAERNIPQTIQPYTT